MKVGIRLLVTVVATALANPASSAEEAISPERAANTIILDESGVQNLRIEMVEVEEQDFETTVFAIGRIEEIPANRSVLSSRISGTGRQGQRLRGRPRRERPGAGRGREPAARRSAADDRAQGRTGRSRHRLTRQGRAAGRARCRDARHLGSLGDVGDRQDPGEGGGDHGSRHPGADPRPRDRRRADRRRAHPLRN